MLTVPLLTNIQNEVRLVETMLQVEITPTYDRTLYVAKSGRFDTHRSRNAAIRKLQYVLIERRNPNLEY